MHTQRLVFFSVLFFLFSVSGAAAQAAKPAADSAASSAPSPEGVLQSYYDAMKAGDFKKGADLVHPEALERFRGFLLPLFDAATAQGEEAEVLPLFKGASDFAALKKFSPAEIFASFLGGLTEMMPAMKAALTTVNATILGSVPEGEVLHFVCRTKATVEGIDASRVEVVSLKRHGNTWRILLSEEIEGMAKALSQSMAGEV